MKAGTIRFLMFASSLPAMAQQPEGEPPGMKPLKHLEIPDPPAVPEHVSTLFVIGVLVLLGLVVTGSILLLFARKTSAAVSARRPIKETLRALKDLRGRAASMKPSEVGYQVSDILRHFYEARYGIRALVRTSQELFPKMEKGQEPQRRRQWRERYEPLASVYDRLSYAPVPATTNEALELIDTALGKLEEERLHDDTVVR